MNNRYAIYTSATGEIQSAVNANADEVAAAHCELDQSFVRVHRPITSRDWVNPESLELIERPETPYQIANAEVPADGATKIVISDLLSGTEVSISGPVNTNYTVDDGSLSFALPEAGKYNLKITAPFPALSKEVTVYGR